MTNREWLESLSDEAFVLFMIKFTKSECDYCIYGKDFDCEWCYDGKIKWLRAEHKEDENDE